VDDVQAKLDEITRTVESARAMPMSASCVVNRAELLAQLGAVRALLPEVMTQAQTVLQDKDSVVAEGREEAARILAEAREERDRLLTEYEVYAAAVEEADRLLAEAQASAASMRAEVEDYVDAKLANFEIVLAKTLRAVERGRQKLAGRDELAELSDEDEDAAPGGIARG
jgi:crotonobetainyl-CoA:carnitine CoA-transferase CaiB-like acyl-CoA transferase